MKPRRIVSFLPAATEMVAALGLADQLVGITHECDYPPAIRSKPVVVRSPIHSASLSQAEIEAAVQNRLRQGLSLYEVDEALLHSLAPDLIVTQNLCQVCAPSGNEVSRALAGWPHPPEILYLTPRSLADIFENLRAIAKATGTADRAEHWITDSQARLEKIRHLTATPSQQPRVAFLEWLDPIYTAGHWAPEMIILAGGHDPLARPQADSVRTTWEAVIATQPEILILSPCGYNTSQIVNLAAPLVKNPGWTNLPAVRQNRVYAVDANACFARPGPRVVDGVELLAHLFHPEICSWKGPAEAFTPLKTKRCPQCSQPFLCTQTHGCWCGSVTIPVETSARLRATCSDCLCQTCLSREAV